MHHPPQVFGAYGPDGSPLPPQLSDPIFSFDHMEPGAGEPDAKRQRIARVGYADTFCSPNGAVLTLCNFGAGLRHVPEEEDQVRRKVAGLLALP
jgi:hypothetical protein